MSDDRNRTASASDQIRVVFRSSLPFNTKSKPRDRCDWFDCKDIYSIWEYQTSWKLPINRTLSFLVRCCSFRYLTWEKGSIKCPWPQFQCYEAVKRRNLNKICMVFNEIMRSRIKVSKVELHTILYMWKAFHPSFDIRSTLIFGLAMYLGCLNKIIRSVGQWDEGVSSVWRNSRF